MNDAAPDSVKGSDGADSSRRTSRVSHCADLQREVAIKHAGLEVEQHMARYAASGDFGDRGAADAARLRMEALIRGRSPEFVRQLELARGLA